MLSYPIFLIPVLIGIVVLFLRFQTTGDSDGFLQTLNARIRSWWTGVPFTDVRWALNEKEQQAAHCATERESKIITDRENRLTPAFEQTPQEQGENPDDVAQSLGFDLSSFSTRFPAALEMVNHDETKEF
jgi:hypothetical protein